MKSQNSRFSTLKIEIFDFVLVVLHFPMLDTHGNEILFRKTTSQKAQPGGMTLRDF